MSQSTDQNIKSLQGKIAELERALGQKQIQIDFYQKMFELAENEYDLDLKKNSFLKPLSGSATTGK